jgi:hypothetical protein
VTVISDKFTDGAHVGDGTFLEFWVPTKRDNDNADAILVERHVYVPVDRVTGVFTTPDLAPGVWKVAVQSTGSDRVVYDIQVPSSGPVRLWPLIETFNPPPAATVYAATLTDLSDSAVQHMVQGPSATKTALDGAYAPASGSTIYAAKDVEASKLDKTEASATYATQVALSDAVEPLLDQSGVDARVRAVGDPVYATQAALATAVEPLLDQAGVDARVRSVGDAAYATPGDVATAVGPLLDQAEVDARVRAVGDTAYAPATGIALTALDGAVQTSLGKADSATQPADVASAVADKLTQGEVDARVLAVGNGAFAPVTGIAQSALASAVQTSLGKADTAAQPADITSAINGLVNAAPAQLDTLQELASALGNDPNFASTISAMVAANETIPVVAQVDWTGAVSMNSTTVAKPKWVKVRLIGNVALTVPAGTANVSYTVALEVLQDATGGRTLTFSGVSWPYTIAPTITTTANARDVLYLTWTGNIWVGSIGAQAVS